MGTILTKSIFSHCSYFKYVKNILDARDSLKLESVVTQKHLNVKVTDIYVLMQDSNGSISDSTFRLEDRTNAVDLLQNLVHPLFFSTFFSSF